MKSSTESLNPYLTIELNAYNEMLRQTRQTFNLYYAVVIISALFGILGSVGFIFHGKTLEGAAAGLTGTGVAAYFSCLAKASRKESDRKLTKLVKEIKLLKEADS